MDRLFKRRNEASMSALWWRYFSALMFLNAGLWSLLLFLCAIALGDISSICVLPIAVVLSLLSTAYHLVYLNRNQFTLNRRRGLRVFLIGSVMFAVGVAIFFKWQSGLGGFSGVSMKMVKLNSLAVFGLGSLYYVIRLWEARHFPRHVSLSGSRGHQVRRV